MSISLEGIPAEIKRNVLASLSLAGAAGEGRLSEGEARLLASRAQGEIREALQPFGYYRPTVTADLSEKGDSWAARYVVDLGPPVQVSSVDVSVTGPGADLPRFREIIQKFPLRPGSRLEHGKYEELKVDLSRTALKSGFLDAKFVAKEVTVDVEADTARIEARFDTGPRYYFGPVRFDQDMLDSSFVQSYVPFEAGEPYNPDSLIAMQNALGASPYFSRVEVEPRPDLAENARVPIDVRLSPAKRLHYTLGAGYGTDTGAEVAVTLELRRLNRKGHRGRIEVLVSERRNSLGLQYQVPRIFGHDELLSYSLALQDEETEAQENRSGSIGVTLARTRGDWQQSFGVFLQRQEFTVGLDQGSPLLLYPEISFTRVRCDDRVNTRSGSRVRLLVRGASEKVASDATFAQADLHWKRIVPAGSRSRVLLRLEGGILGTGDFHDLPSTIRYFAGGAQSVRAYEYQELGPRDASGAPIGGSKLVFGSVEYDYRLFGRWALAVFYDAGNALQSFDDALANGAGGGVRWISPVGMVRLDAAQALDDPSHHVQFQISIGPDL